MSFQGATRPGIGGMERKKGSAATDLLEAIVPLFSDLLPLIMEKWAVANDRPLVRELEKEQDRLDRKLESTDNRLRWLYSFFFLLFIWNVFLTIFLVFVIK